MSSTTIITRLGLASLLMYGVLNAIAGGTISAVLLLIQDEFAHENSLYVKMVATSLGLGMFFGAPVGGYCADRLGRRPVMLGATLLYGVAGCAVLLSHNLWQVIFARFLIGLGLGALGSAMIAMISDVFADRERSRWIGYTAAVGTLSAIVISPASAFVADISWRSSFLVYASAFPAAACMYFGFVAPAKRTLPSDGAVGGRSHDRFRVPWSVIAVGIVAGTISTGTAIYTPFRLREVGVGSAGWVAMSLIPSTVVVGLSAAAYGKLRQTLDIDSVFLVASMSSCIGLAVVSIAPNSMVIVIGMMLEGFAVGVLMPNASMYAVAQSSEAFVGRTVGLMKGALFGSPFLTQFVLEPISKKAGGSAAAIAAIAALSGSMAITFAIRHVARSRSLTAAAKGIGGT